MKTTKLTREQIEQINNNLDHKFKPGEKVTLLVELEVDVTPPTECTWANLNEHVVQAILSHDDLMLALVDLNVSPYQD